MESKKINVVLIEPEEWSHIDAHKLLNRAVASFANQMENLSEKIQEVNFNAGEKYSSAFSEVNKIKGDIEELRKTIGKISDKIDTLQTEIKKPKEYITKNFEWIIDTDTQTVSELEKIELNWAYLVNIVVNEVIPNWWTMTYSFPQTSIAKNEYTPRVYLMANEWEHAVLEYDFTVILTPL